MGSHRELYEHIIYIIIIGISTIGGFILFYNVIYGILFYLIFGIIGAMVIYLVKKYPEYKKRRKGKKVMDMLDKYPKSEDRDW